MLKNIIGHKLSPRSIIILFKILRILFLNQGVTNKFLFILLGISILLLLVIIVFIFIKEA